MEITIIVLLLFLGVLLMLVEVFLLPGLTVAAVLSLCSFVTGLYFAYEYFGLMGFLISTICSFVVLVILFFVSIRKKSLKKLSLEDVIDSKSSENASVRLNIGDKGVTKTRLNPMGTVFVSGEMFEAKSFDGYVDSKVNVEIVGFADSVVVVKTID